MRFLSKKWIVLFLMMVSILITSFLCLYSPMQKVPNCCVSIMTQQGSFGKAAFNRNDQDDTTFNLYYQNKTWTFKAKEFEADSKLFTLKERIKRHKSGSREDKIDLIKKLIKINIPPEIAFNYIYFGFNNKINIIQKNIEKTPKNAEISIKNNKINIKKETVGIKFDKYLFYDNLIKKYLKNNKIINLEIPTIQTTPKITKEHLAKYTHKRAEFSTSISTSNSARKFNIRKALNVINGTCLIKNEKFSFNNCVGQRTSDKGYKQAKVILDGEFVEGVGGGVCQVSSTLYNAALLAGLKIVSSQKHSQRVGYVKAGFDAMVNYGTSDLVFENNTSGNVYILCNYSDSRIVITIYGESLNNISYDRQNEIVDQVHAGEDEIVCDEDGKYLDKVKYKDESFELKKARDGYTIKSYLIKCVDGVAVEKILLRSDKYLPQHRVVVYGAQERPKEVQVLEEELISAIIN